MKEESSIFRVEKIQTRYLDHQCHAFISLDLLPKVKLHQKKLSTFTGLEGLAVVFQRAGTLSYS